MKILKNRIQKHGFFRIFCNIRNQRRKLPILNVFQKIRFLNNKKST